MKKLILIVGLILLVSSMAFAGDYDSTTGEMSITLQRGWNLVPTMTSATDTRNCLYEADWLYYYSGAIKQYVGTSIKSQGSFYPNKTTYEQVTTTEYKFPSSINNPYYGIAQFGGMWVYSNKYCTFKTQLSKVVDTYEMPEVLSKAKLTSGWNFINIHPWMVGRSMNQIFSNCNVIAVNNWDPIDQNWIYASSTGMGDAVSQNTAIISETNVGLVMPIKVANNCYLNYDSRTTGPPALPD